MKYLPFNKRLLRLPSLLATVISLLIMTGACGSSRKVTRGHHGHRGGHRTEVRIPSDISADRKAVVKEAQTWVGAPYRYAGDDKKKGTDCSGMVLRIYEDVLGIKLPRNSAKQAEFCKRLKARDVKPGDLVFFATGKDPDCISHVGIMLNDDDFVHASTSKGVVISQVSTPYYQRTFKMYGRAGDLK